MKTTRWKLSESCVVCSETLSRMKPSLFFCAANESALRGKENERCGYCSYSFFVHDIER